MYSNYLCYKFKIYNLNMIQIRRTIFVLSFVLVNMIWSWYNYYNYYSINNNLLFRNKDLQSQIKFSRKLLSSNDHINATKFLKHQINDIKAKLLYHESRIDHLKFQLQEILIADSKNYNIIINDKSFEIDKYLNNNTNTLKHRLNIDYSLLNYKKLKDRSIAYWKEDTSTPIMLGVLDELILRRSSQWFSSTKGMYITSSLILEERLELARKKHNQDCRRDDLLAFICVITKNDDVDLQEWIVWQIAVVGIHHIIVYMNDPESDHTEDVLKPFIQAGYVTAIKYTGVGKQNLVYNECVHLIKTKSCSYPGKGHLESYPNCNPSGDVDNYNGKDRPVWVAGFDTDEFVLDTSGRCFIDSLYNYTDYNGLMIPWYCFGHSDHFLPPEDKLVTEAYTHRMLGGGGYDKSFSRVYHITSMKHGHSANYRNKQLGVDEFFNPMDWHDARQYNATSPGNPRLRLHHYMTKSVEHLVKKWSRGMADYIDRWGRSEQRSNELIIGWLEGYALDWRDEDKNALPGAAVVRSVLFG